MSSLVSLLPRPRSEAGESKDHEAKDAAPSVKQGSIVSTTLPSPLGIPKYGARHGWVPKVAGDFGDGGAYPEILVAQYPLGMGRKKHKGNTVQIKLDGEGKVQYDELVKQGVGKGKIVHSKFKQLLPKDIDSEDPSFQRPDTETVQKTLDSTKEALEKIVNTKISSARPSEPIAAAEKPQFVRYTPADQNQLHNSGASQKIIRMYELRSDPMEPPKFKHKLAPRGPPSPPAPVMQSPPRKVTVEDQNNWKIPPSISNWKNPKGYTVALDKRLAADGRGLQEVVANDNFSKLAEALYIADRKAREAVELRAQVQKKLAQKEKEKKEESLRLLAQKAREERAGVKGLDSIQPGRKVEESYDEEVKYRDEIREQRREERDRQRRAEKAGRRKPGDLRDRDVSEMVALGLPVKVQADNIHDQRLFNQSQGMNSGFTEDDSMGIYDQPLFSGSGAAAAAIYRPSKNLSSDTYGDEFERLKNTQRFTAEKGFEGASAGEHQRTGPVQFEKHSEEDLFGLDKFLTDARKGKNALDHIGKKGTLMAGGSGTVSEGFDFNREVRFRSGDDSGEKHQKKPRRE